MVIGGTGHGDKSSELPTRRILQQKEIYYGVVKKFWMNAVEIREILHESTLMIVL